MNHTGRENPDSGLLIFIGAVVCFGLFLLLCACAKHRWSVYCLREKVALIHAECIGDWDAFVPKMMDALLEAMNVWGATPHWMTFDVLSLDRFHVIYDSGLHDTECIAICDAGSAEIILCCARNQNALLSWWHVCGDKKCLTDVLKALEEKVGI